LSEDGIRVDWNRVLSLTVAVAWVGFVIGRFGIREIVNVWPVILLALTLIWRPGLFGSYAAREGWWQANQADSAGCVVRIIGWALLCVSVLVNLAVLFRS
jgi:hypothetical protein